ncbi:MAG: argininosuccinate lyase [Deltaproteobacteria bacterium RBG_16_71_12]|nr:MAG: argininosuccinate lyase [Deltaproteobacteria bacterium RBG_16_71_12]
MSNASPLWAKGRVELDAAVQRFCAADDIKNDRELFVHDVKGSIAHVNALYRAAIVTIAERDALAAELVAVGRDFMEGRFTLDERFEDCHSAIEARLTERLGEVGMKVHTARSRNDQVLTALRLYVRAQLERLQAVCTATCERLLARAKASASVPMPGWTHLQRAMPTSLGAFLAGHAEGFLDDAHATRAALEVVDACPLGTGAGFGTSVELDRDGEAAELGFVRLALNVHAAQTGRGKLELFALQALHLATLDVRRFAWDLSLFASQEGGFVRLPDAYTTGSSLMPNKRNPDVIELLRTLAPTVEGAMQEVAGVLALPSGYHRDLQATKAPLLRAFARGLAGLDLVPALVDALAFDEAALRAAITPDMYATDRALELVTEGVPFREAYRRAAAEIPTLAERTPEASLRARRSLGAAGNLAIERLEERLRSLKAV